MFILFVPNLIIISLRLENEYLKWEKKIGEGFTYNKLFIWSINGAIKKKKNKQILIVYTTSIKYLNLFLVFHTFLLLGSCHLLCEEGVKLDGKASKRGGLNPIWKIGSSDNAVKNLCSFFHLILPECINLGENQG